MGKNPPATEEMWVWSLGREDPRKEAMATHSIILALRIPETEDSGGLLTIQRVAKSQTRLKRLHTGAATHKKINSEDLLYAENYIQCLTVTYNGKEYICI